MNSSRKVRLWTEHGAPQPFDTGPDNLFVGQYSSAEWLAFQMLGWQVPVRVIDTYTEGRVLTNGGPGRKGPKDDKREGRRRGCGLTDLAWRYGITAMTETLKDSNRKLVMRGGPWSPQEQNQMLDYCLEDVITTAKVFEAMVPEILAPTHGLAHALTRGRYMRADAAMSYAGIPIDLDLFNGIREHWPLLRKMLIEAVDPGRYDCFEQGQFKECRFERLIIDRMGILDWPRAEHGSLKRDSRTLKDLATTYPELNDFRELYSTLQQMKNFDLGIGQDGRHRTDMLSPFGADTARHTPSKFVFALATWFRGLIKAGSALAVLYSDYGAQEVYIAAWLSKDPNLIAAAISGDPYLWFLKKVGLVPENATKQTHGKARNWIKPFLLGIHYGLTASGAAVRLGIPNIEAERLVRKHKELFPMYWRWTEDRVQQAYDDGEIRSRWGWRMYVGEGTKPRSVQNHPIQNMGAHILQFAIMGLTECGIRVLAPVHDAVLHECRIEEIEEHCAKVQQIMQLAAKTALGLEIPVDTKVYAWPNRYMDGRGVSMFNLVARVLADIHRRKGVGGVGRSGRSGRVDKKLNNSSLSSLSYSPDTSPHATTPTYHTPPDLPPLDLEGKSWPAPASMRSYAEEL
jgi:DNA polymerase-1